MEPDPIAMLDIQQEQVTTGSSRSGPRAGARSAARLSGSSSWSPPSRTPRITPCATSSCTATPSTPSSSTSTPTAQSTEYDLRGSRIDLVTRRVSFPLCEEKRHLCRERALSGFWYRLGSRRQGVSRDRPVFKARITTFHGVPDNNEIAKAIQKSMISFRGWKEGS